MTGESDGENYFGHLQSEPLPGLDWALSYQRLSYTKRNGRQGIYSRAHPNLTVTIWPSSIYWLCVYDALDGNLEQFQVHILHNHTFLVFNVLYKNEKKNTNYIINLHSCERTKINWMFIKAQTFLSVKTSMKQNNYKNCFMSYLE